MKDKRETSHHEQEARRSRGLARSLAGRIALGPDGTVYLVQGELEFDSAAAAFPKLRPEMFPSTRFHPTLLGFHAHQVTQVTARGLTARGRALKKWEVAVSQQLSSRRLNSARRTELRSWQTEIDALSAQLDLLYKLTKGPPPGDPDSTPSAGATPTRCLVLLPEVRAEVERVRRWYQGHSWDLSVGLLSEALAWIGGPPSMRRFLESYRPKQCTIGQFVEREVLLGLREAAQRMHKECSSSGSLSAAERKARDLRQHEQLKRLAAPLTESLVPLKRPGDLQAVITTCTQKLESYPKIVRMETAASIALLCLFDHRPSPVASCLLESEPDRLSKSVRILCEKSQESYYDALLELIARRPALLVPWQIRDLSLMFEAGATYEDVLWAEDHHFYVDEQPVSPAPVRQLVNFLADHDAPLDEKLLERLNATLSEIASVQVPAAILEWVQLLDREAVTPKMAQAIRGHLERLAWSGSFESLRGLFAQWCNPPRRFRGVPELPDSFPEEAVVWVRRLAYYQKFGGETPSFPQSLARPWEQRRAWDRQIQHLDQLSRERELTAAERERRQRLHDHLSAPLEIPAAKLLRQAQQSCAMAALDALQRRIDHFASEWWERSFGITLDAIPTSFALDIAGCYESLEDEPKRRFRETVEAWQKSGPRFRLEFEANQTWMKRAAAAGVDLEAWSNPEEAIVNPLSEYGLQVRSAASPFEVFLMGSLFNTCLSARDGCNRDALLANARDANKVVLYVVDASGRRLARKLVALTSRFELVGFRTYVTDEDSLPVSKAHLIDELDCFCAAWARACRVPLASSGSVPSLENLFWYDDGTVGWSVAAHRLAEATDPAATARPRVNRPIPTAAAAELPPDPQSSKEWSIAEALRTQDRHWLAQLADGYELIDQAARLRSALAFSPLTVPEDTELWPLTFGYHPHGSQDAVVNASFQYNLERVIRSAAGSQPASEAAQRINVEWAEASRERWRGFACRYCWTPPGSLAGTSTRQAVRYLRAGLSQDAAETGRHRHLWVEDWSYLLLLLWYRDGDLEPLIDMLESSSPDEWSVILKLLTLQQIPDLFTPLRRLLTRGSHDVKWNVAEVLAHHGEPQDAERLATLARKYPDARYRPQFSTSLRDQSFLQLVEQARKLAADPRDEAAFFDCAEPWLSGKGDGLWFSIVCTVLLDRHRDRFSRTLRAYCADMLWKAALEHDELWLLHAAITWGTDVETEVARDFPTPAQYSSIGPGLLLQWECKTDQRETCGRYLRAVARRHPDWLMQMLKKHQPLMSPEGSDSLWETIGDEVPDSFLANTTALHELLCVPVDHSADWAGSYRFQLDLLRLLAERTAPKTLSRLAARLQKRHLGVRIDWLVDQFQKAQERAATL